MNLSTLHKPLRKLKNKTGVSAEKPLRILHMDITEIKALDGTKIYISLIIDNFSRCIFNSSVTAKWVK